MTPTELYKLVFNAPGGKELLADLSGYVQRLDPQERGAASLPILRIIRLLNEPERAKTTKLRPIKASGGRIEHG